MARLKIYQAATGMSEARIGCARLSSTRSKVQRNPTMPVVMAHSTRKRAVVLAARPRRVSNTAASSASSKETIKGIGMASIMYPVCKERLLTGGGMPA
ncbi:hypothetical protein D3C84_863490 [compost metagenome]